MYTIAVNFLKIFFSIFGGKRHLVGEENIPRSKPCVVVCNHSTFFDVIYLGIMLYPTHIHYMAKKELFKGKFLNWLFHSLHAFPVDRSNPGPSVIRIPLSLLKQGKAVGIFPTGTRTSENAGLKKGATTIAQLARVDILPCHYEGPKSLKELLTRQPITLTVHQPISMNKEIKNREEQNDYLLAKIEEVIF